MESGLPRLPGLVVRDGARRIMLDRLSADESTDLLGRLLGRQRLLEEPQACADLVLLCSGLPLALRTAAERVSRHPATTLAATVAELNDQALGPHPGAATVYDGADDRQDRNRPGHLFYVLAMLTVFQDARVIAGDLGDERGRMFALITMGIVPARVGERPWAQGTMGDHDAEAGALNTIGGIHLERGKPEDVLEYRRQA